ncbi:MAG: phosphoglucosamine mutase [Methanocalculus sp. MSAO_Arc1]|uniref:phosphoglucosamine mutase n=1 Tax=Methanocalculus TaxID=71151 RepID=UPI000FF130F9|nr:MULTISPECIES: phosphoglucosamine mutase [unclassified Methanocalculus]MCP1663319.1 phosphomannomutase/phosphoglucomutase [Methanocalculus sp. AMF5]RQD79989.1 MAG: phosphoglucosamine mutase [Methanocalculus sp. MSAO_Arc1]
MTQLTNERKAEKVLFGTNGVRGIIGEDMNPELVMKIGLSLGTMLKGKIALGRDTRTSGEALASAMKAGLLATGCDVVDLGILPTPALQYLVREYYDGGAMITASHNPPEYNGVKVIEADGTEMDDDRTIQLEASLFSGEVPIQDWRNVGSLSNESHRLEEYIHAIISRFPENCCRGLTVVVDPGSGPAAATTPAILRRMGCTVHTINGRFDGNFPGRLPEPDPEGLALLSETVLATGADVGVAHDGDADRAVFVDENGLFLNENTAFALLAESVCSRNPGIIVTPISTSDLIREVGEKHGCRTMYTRVGSIYVARTMLKLLEEGHDVAFGGEGNGGLIFPKHQFCRDGGMTAAAMAAYMAESGQKLSSLATLIPSYTMLKDKIHSENADALLEKARSICSHQTINEIDGIHIRWNDAWALIRPSGTEPFIRMYCESKDSSRAEEIRQLLLQQLQELFD